MILFIYNLSKYSTVHNDTGQQVKVKVQGKHNQLEGDIRNR